MLSRMLAWFALWLGYSLMFAIALGWIGLIDFRMCVAPKGGCAWRADDPGEAEPVGHYLTAMPGAVQPPEFAHG